MGYELMEMAGVEPASRRTNETLPSKTFIPWGNRRRIFGFMYGSFRTRRLLFAVPHTAHIHHWSLAPGAASDLLYHVQASIFLFWKRFVIFYDIPGGEVSFVVRENGFVHSPDSEKRVAYHKIIILIHPRY